jgi:hypothetical protein
MALSVVWGTAASATADQQGATIHVYIDFYPILQIFDQILAYLSRIFILKNSICVCDAKLTPIVLLNMSKIEIFFTPLHVT